MLLERLLFKTEEELEFYKKGDNCIYMGRKETQWGMKKKQPDVFLVPEDP